jgi:hypothetical protein
VIPKSLPQSVPDLPLAERVHTSMKTSSRLVGMFLLGLTVSAVAQNRIAIREEGNILPVSKGVDVSRDETPVGQGLRPNGSLPNFVKFTGTARAAQDPNALITLSIYADENGGSPIWSESQTAAVNSAKQFTVLMGAANAQGLPADIFSSGEARWLGVRVNGGEEQARVLLVSVPYAMKSGDSDSLGGKPASAYVLADSLVNYMSASRSAARRDFEPDSPGYPGNPTSAVSTTGGTSGYVPVFSTDNVILDSNLFQNGTWMGVGLTSPRGRFNGHGEYDTVTFEVAGSVAMNGFEADDRGIVDQDNNLRSTTAHTQNNTPDGNALEANAWGGGQSFGLFATTHSPSGGGAVGLAFNDPSQVLGTDTAFAFEGVNQNHYGAGVIGFSVYNPTSIVFGDPILNTSVGLMGIVVDPTGIAGVLKHAGDGQILSAQNSTGEVLSISALGDLTTSGIISGNGSGITNVSAANLAAGSYTGAYTFTNGSNSFTGNGSGLTNVNASQLNGSSDTAFAKLASSNAFTNSNSFSGVSTFTGNVDATTSGHTLPVRTFTGSLPTGGGTCTASKELIIRTDGSSGNQLFICNTTGDGWTAVNTDPPPAQDPLDTAYTNLKFGQVRLLANAFSPGSLSTRNLAVFTPEQAITIKRISAVFQNAGATCDTDPVITVSNGTGTVNLTLTTGTSTFDSSVTSTNLAANTQITISATAGTGASCLQPTDGNILIEYKMQ